jgi:tetraacyldisaccharide 4'-kinase
VGNIAWGGSGKTPFVGWLLAWAERRGLKAVVLTRGYKARPGKEPLLVRGDSPPDRAGDEALMLARAFPRADVLAFPDRVRAARLAEQRLLPDLMILDDGMQHLAVRRDVDIVLLRPEDLREDWNRVIPAGPWREGADSLTCASVFAVKAGDEEFAHLRPLAEARLTGFRRPLFSFTLVPTGLRPLFPGMLFSGKEENADASPLEPERCFGRPYILFSGVGNPAGVATTAVRLLGRPPERHFVFADHHRYSLRDARALLAGASASLPIVCTAKDAVKIAPFAAFFGAVPVWVLETRLEFGPALFTDAGFVDWWETALSKGV